MALEDVIDEQGVDTLADRLAPKVGTAVRQANEPVLEALGRNHSVLVDNNRLLDGFDGKLDGILAVLLRIEEKL